MNFSRRFFLIATILVFATCARHAYDATWKAPNTRYKDYNKILVVGVIQDTDLTQRRAMETHLVNDLHKLGYTAVSALAEFGAHGLASLAQEQTYQVLCNKGIDGMLTIALLNKSSEHAYVPAQVKYKSNLFYYNRILSYREMAADLNSPTLDSAAFQWESIFFDVTTLEPLYIVQTKYFAAHAIETEAQRYGKNIVSGMVDNKLLRKKAPVKADTVHAF
jgi:hypothetical protein